MFRTLVLISILMLSLNTTASTLFLAGDSTMSIKADNKRPETGWGEALTQHISSQHKLVNLAVNGRSTRSFLDQGRWQQLLDQLQTGDLVIIQFGHNDQKINDPLRFTDPWRDYRWNLERFVKDVIGKGATPLLLNSVARRKFDAQSIAENSHMPYSEVVKQVAEQNHVRFIDMTELSSQWLNQLGVEASRSFYLHVANGHPNYPEGKVDNTHLNPQGAAAISSLFLSAVNAQYPELANWFKH